VPRPCLQRRCCPRCSARCWRTSRSRSSASAWPRFANP